MEMPVIKLRRLIIIAKQPKRMNLLEERGVGTGSAI